MDEGDYENTNVKFRCWHKIDEYLTRTSTEIHMNSNYYACAAFVMYRETYG